jgi:hypothetical protein
MKILDMMVDLAHTQSGPNIVVEALGGAEQGVREVQGSGSCHVSGNFQAVQTLQYLTKMVRHVCRQIGCNQGVIDENQFQKKHNVNKSQWRGNQPSR